MQAFEINGKRHLPAKHVLLRFLTTPFVFLVGRLFQITAGLNWKHVKSHEEMRGNVASGGFDQSLSRSPFLISKRFAGLKIYAMLLVFVGVLSFKAQGQTTVTLGTGTLTLSGIAPFFTDPSDMATTSSRVQYFYTAADLTAGGWTAGAGYSITQFGWRIANNNSNASFANYTIRMANANPTTYPDNSSAPDFPFASLTTVKNAFTFQPTNTNGYQMITLDAPFTWDGTSNLVVDVCFSEGNFQNHPLVYRFNSPGVTGVVRYNFGTSGSLCSTATGYQDAPAKAQAQLVFTAAASCTAPTSQATIGSYTNNVTPGTSLTLNWSRGTPSPGNEVIVVGRLTATADVAPTSGTTYAANAAFGTVGTTTGTGNFVVYKGTGTSVNVAALTANTSYTFTVYEYNSTGTCYKTPGSSSAVTTWAPPTYCTPLYANGACFGNWDIIHNVSIGTGGTVLNQSATGCSGAVADYTSASLNINMTQGVTYPFSITTITDISSPHLAVWIDFNDNGVFSSGEWLVDVQSNGSGVFSGNFTIPGGAATGNHRMRIRAAATTFVNGSSSCEEGSYGEAHDYLVTIVAAPSIAIADNSQVTAGSPLQGATNALLYRAAITVTTANATLTGMTFTTAGGTPAYVDANLTNLKVWYQTTSTFSGSGTLLGTISVTKGPGTKTLTSLSQAINVGTPGYIYITADIAAGATAGNQLRVNALTTADFTFSSGTKSGTPTIGGVQTITAPPPTFTITPTTLTALNYTQCSGPSTAQSFTVSGSNLTTGSGNITVIGSTNYEVSTTSSTTGFASSVTLPYSGGVITSQPRTVWVRLKAGLFSGNYNSESITISGGGVSPNGSVTCSGTVSASGGTTTYTIGTQSTTTSNYPIDRTNTGTRCSRTGMSYSGTEMRAVDSPNLPGSTTYTGIAWKPSATFTGTLSGTLNIWMRVDGSATNTWSTTSATQVYTGTLSSLAYTAGTWLTFIFTSNFTADLSTAGALTILVEYTSTAGGDPTWDAASFGSSGFSYRLGGATCGSGSSSSGSGSATLPIFQLIAGSAPATPTLTRSPTTLTGFTYAQGAGPSTSQSFNISGANLVCSPGTLTVTGSTNYEVSNNNSTFGATTTIAYSSATLAATPVYVRLKAGLLQASYNSETITISGSGATAVTVTCSGNVTAVVIATPTVTTPTATAIATTSATLGANVTSNGGASLTERGTVWGTSAAPTGNVLAEGATSTGVFTHSRTGLTANTLYTYRGYATNSGGPSYSADGTFTTLSLAPTIGAGTSATSSGFTANWTAPGSQGSATYTYTVEVDDDSNFGSVNATGSSIASGTLLYAFSALSSGTTYYYRVKAVNAGGSSAWSSTSASIITTVQTYTWNGSTSSAWNTATNWTPNGVPTAATNVNIPAVSLPNVALEELSSLTINTNRTFTLQSNAKLTLNGIITNNGTLTIENGATLLQTGTGTNAGTGGTYNVKQAITGEGTGTPSGRFWYVGSPVSGATSAVYDAAGANILKYYSESANAWQEITDNTSSLEVGRGYFVQAATGTTELNFTGGTINNNTYTLNVSRNTTTNAFRGYNLLTNPYPSYLDWDNVTRSNVGTTMWYRSVNNAGTMVFDTYNAPAGTGTNNNQTGAVTRYIPPMQSFWVNVPQGQTTGTVSFGNAQRSHYSTGVQGLRSSAQDFPAFLRLNLLDGNFVDQTILYMKPDANNTFDEYDSEKMFLGGVPQFYSTVNAKKLVLNGMKNQKARTSVPLTMELPSSKSYTFQAEEFNIEDGLILLEDKQESVIQDLTINPTYAFFGNAGTNATRFVVHFQLASAPILVGGPQELESLGSEDLTTDNIQILSNNQGTVIIRLDDGFKPEGSIRVFDASGRLLEEIDFKEQETTIQLNGQAGMYFVEVNTGKVLTKKKIVIGH
jgi:hypothetical protein